MIRKIKGSLVAKVFLSTVAMLSGIALLVFGLLAWLMPQTYSNEISAVLDGRVRAFLSELEQVAFSESGGLFDQFVQNPEIHSVALYRPGGALVPLPTERFYEEGEIGAVQEAVAGYDESAPIQSDHYYFSFSDSSRRYMLIVYGTAEQIAELRQSFLRILPLLLPIIFTVAFMVSLLYSRMVTKPVLEISRVSEKMSGLQLDWQVHEQRTDELGTLGKSLNTLSRSLSVALADLRNANRKLEADMLREKELMRAQTDFFSAVSHELKTPITIIKGQLEGMLLGIGAYKDHKKYLARSLETAKTLETLVQEILTVARLETAGADLKKCRLDCITIIRSYLNETEDLIIKKDLQIELGLPPEAFINGNQMLMEKVFSNLIGNAILYAPQGASIRVCAFARCGKMEFSIENTGTHIPDDCIPRLFEAFYRMEGSRSRKTGGSGLGLYIVQEILRQHGSGCEVCNTPSGVKFSFTIV